MADSAHKTLCSEAGPAFERKALSFLILLWCALRNYIRGVSQTTVIRDVDTGQPTTNNHQVLPVATGRLWEASYLSPLRLEGTLRNFRPGYWLAIEGNAEWMLTSALRDYL
jgi:hypothetical protein